MIHQLSKFFVRNLFSISIFTIIMLVASVVSSLHLPIKVMPAEATPSFFYLQVAPTETGDLLSIESTVTKPIEGLIQSLPSIKEFETTTSKSNINIAITYKPNTNLDYAEILLRESLQGLSNSHLIDPNSIVVTRFNPESSAIAQLALTLEKSVQIDKMAELKLKTLFEAIPEVSKIEISGLNTLTHEFNLDISTLNALGVDINSMSQLFSSKNEITPIGHLLFNDTKELPINLRYQLNDLSSLRSQKLKSGSVLSLQGLASETAIQSIEQNLNHKDGRSTIFIDLYIKDGSNLFTFDDHLSNTVEKLRHQNIFPGEIDIQTIFNKKDKLQLAINKVSMAILQSFLIILFTLIFFIRRLGPTLVIASSIPIALILTLAILYLNGSSLNLLTLSGLILAIGLIVDNAVVVVDHYDRLPEKMTKQDRIVDTISAVAPALFMSTLTSIVIFLPAAFLEPGEPFTDLLKAFQKPIIFSLISAYIAALIVIPLVLIRLPKENINLSKKDSSGALINFIKKIFSFTYQHKNIAGLICLLFTVIAFNSARNIETVDLSPIDDPFIPIQLKFSSEMSVEMKKKEFLRLEMFLNKIKPAIGVTFVLGQFSTKSLSGVFQLFPKEENGEIEDIKSKIKKQISFHLQNYKTLPGAHISDGSFSFDTSGYIKRSTFTFIGTNSSILLSELTELKKSLLEISGIKRVLLPQDIYGRPSIEIVPYPSLTNSLNLKPEKISRAISSNLSQISLSQLQNGASTVAAKINLNNQGKSLNQENLLNMPINFGNGKLFPLSQIAKFEEKLSLTSLKRSRGLWRSKIQIFSNNQLSTKDTSELNSEIKDAIRSHDFPPGYGLEPKNSSDRLDEMNKNGNFVIILSGLLIYLILASLFESLLIPFSIMLTVPLTVIFGILGLYLCDMELDVMARLSLIILVGIGVNNAIILVDQMLRLKKQGLPNEISIPNACIGRFRAVIMSSATTILGILPVALGNSKLMGIPFSSLGVCIISGMLLSTIVTFLLLPISYEVLSNLEDQIKIRLFGD